MAINMSHNCIQYVLSIVVLLAVLSKATDSDAGTLNGTVMNEFKLRYCKTNRLQLFIAILTYLTLFNSSLLKCVTVFRCMN
jgi:hypothetical protein